jgi:hypothetical protein
MSLGCAVKHAVVMMLIVCVSHVLLTYVDHSHEYTPPIENFHVPDERRAAQDLLRFVMSDSSGPSAQPSAVGHPDAVPSSSTSFAPADFSS